MSHMHNGRSGCRGHFNARLEQGICNKRWHNDSKAEDQASQQQRGTPGLLLRYVASTQTSRIYRVPRLIAPSYNRFDEPWRGHIGTLAPHGLIELMRLVWGVRLV
jgi:hypothetical protein